MKKNTFILLLLLCKLAICNAQDTIYLTDTGYWFPQPESGQLRSVGYVHFPGLYGYLLDTLSGQTVSGLCCSKTNEAECTLFLIKYIGPDSLLFDSFGPGGYTPTYYNVVNKLYTIVDSVYINLTCPTEYLAVQYGDKDTLLPVYSKCFETTHVLDSSLYFVALAWRHDYAVYNFNNNTPFLYLTDVNSINILSIAESYSCFFSHNTPPCVFPIIGSHRCPDSEGPCFPRSCPRAKNLTVSVEERVATISWSGDSLHCGYELMLGDVTEPVSSHTVFHTTDTFLLYNLMMPEVNYVCRVRALRCFDDGDTAWSSWSDTVQFHRPMFRVSGRSNNVHWGYVEGSGIFDPGTEVFLEAFPRSGNFRFTHWHTGDTTDTISFTIVCDTVFTAFFEPIDTTGTDTLSVYATTDGKVTLSPNPASGHITVSAACRISDVEVVNMAGRSVMRREEEDTTATIDVSSLPEGTYLVRIKTDCGIAVKRFVKK